MHSYKKLIFFFLGICFFLFGFYLRWKTLDFVYFNEWIARDIERAFNLIEGINIPLAGPELNNGGRLPGPFLYFLLAIPLLFKKSIESIFYFNFAINTFALVFLFFMIKKNFGIFVAILNLIFISVYLPNIFVFSFPANPSFIFPLIALYLWFLLELVCKGEHKYLPIIVLLVSLGIQLHMSMATLYFPPIILLLIFKSRPQTKYLVLSLFVILICFFPYWLYKFKTFIPITEIKNNGSFYFLSSNILIRFLEIIFLKSTILRLTYNNGFESRLLFTNEIVVAYFCLFCFGLIYWIFKFYKKGFQFYKKEFVVFISFYIPAILYEVIGVGMFHLWYTNIFVYSIFLLTSLAIYGVYKDLSRYKVSYIIFLIQLFLILTLANDAYRQVLIYKNMIASRDLKTNYKNTNKLIAVISDA